MTVSSSNRKAGPFLGNGVTTAFPFTFKVFKKEDVAVTFTNVNGADILLIADSSYSVSLNSDQDNNPGGTIIYPISGTPLQTGEKLTFTGALAYTQPTDLPNPGPYFARVVEDAFDRAEIQLQQIKEITDRSIKISVSDTPLTPLPAAASRANMLIGFDALGGVVVVPEPASIGAGDRVVNTFVAGVDYTAGVTTQLVLSRPPGAPGNLEIHFDTDFQGPDQWSLSGNTVTFASPIPAGPLKVFATIGTTLSISIPPDGSVGDSQILWGSILNRVVGSVAALKALDTSKYQRAFATGFYADGDLGGGPYWFDPLSSATEIPGLIVAPTTGSGRWKLIHNGSISVCQLGAKGVGTDDTAAIQAALNAPVHDVYFPAGNFVVTSPWNLTNRTAGVPMRLHGAGAHYDHAGGTIITCRTNGWMVDFTGSQFITVEDMAFVTDGVSPAKNGFLAARSTVNLYAMYVTLNRVVVRLPTNLVATAAGSVALLTNSAEHFTATDCWFESDTPYATTLANDLSVASAYATIDNTVFSNTAVSFRMCTFTSIAFSAMLFYGAGSFTFDTCVWIPVGAAYANGVIFRNSAASYQGNFNIRMTGQIESYAKPFRFDAGSQNVDIAVTLSNVAGPMLDFAAGGVHENLRFRPSPLNNGTVQTAVASGASVTLRGGELDLNSSLKLVDTNIVLAGTVVVGGNLDMGNPANFSVNAASSYRVLWAFDRLHFSTTFNPGTIAATSSGGATFAAAGVVLGDKVTVYPPYDLQGCIAQACVSSAGNIRITVSNLTGSPVTFGSGTWKFDVERATF